MASSVFKPSRILAVALVIGAGLWIYSGVLAPGDEEPPPAEVSESGTAEEVQIPVQKVGVISAVAQKRERQVVLSCVTEAENRARAVARGAGVLVDLSVSRGDEVAAGDVIAVISDEGRQAAVLQAEALLEQRMAEYEANKTLIERGDAPRNQLPALEAAVAAARAAVAAASAEADRSLVKSPIDGVVDSVPAQIGQAVQIGMEIAEIVDPDPMLAVGSVSENRRASVRSGQTVEVRFIDGVTVGGTVEFVGLSANPATRTYPVEAMLDNAAAEIADGVTCEMAVSLEPIEAVAIPRSALVFSDDGHLGVRLADGDGRVRFMPIDIVDDGLQNVWIAGVEDDARVIVVGQDFVKDGDHVEAVAAAKADPDAEPPA